MKMFKFKVGDIVRCISTNDPRLKVGGIFEVIYIDCDLLGVIVDKDELFFFDTRFEPFNPEVTKEMLPILNI